LDDAGVVVRWANDWYRIRYGILEILAILATLARRKVRNRKDIATVDRIPKLDVVGSNPIARS
jgi:hypothetical protein